MTPTNPFPAPRGAVSVMLRVEGLALFASGTAAFAVTHASWWLFAGLFLAPDLGMLGYLLGRKAGAIAYNALHTTPGPVLLALLAWIADDAGLYPIAAIWAAHIGFDRAAGYGLKYASAFGDTHLGRVGKARHAG